jgi:hypothetical protein
MSRRPDPKRVARLHLRIAADPPLYPDAGENAQPEVREAIERFAWSDGSCAAATRPGAG